MPKTVTATEAKNRFGAMMSWALEAKDEVIVESHGVPKVAIVPYEEYEQVAAWRERERRRKAVAEIEALVERVRARNKDLTEAQAIELADRVVRETVENMVADGKVTYGE
jgi:prevent-host-death family protein